MYYLIWVATEVLLIIATLSLWVVAPEHLLLNISASIFTLILGFILFYPRRSSFEVWIKSRRAKNATIQLTQGFLVFCILSLISFLAWKFPLQIDTTERSLNTLSDQTRRILVDVPKEARVTLFARRADWPRAMAMLKLYKAERSDLVLDAIDPEAQPQLAKSLGIRDNGTVVIEAMGKKISFILKDELSITNAFLKVMRAYELNVYFTWGHGEVSCEDKNTEGASAFCEKLIDQNFRISKIDLQTNRDVPKNADVVVIWGAQSDFLTQEILRLQRYLEKGGSLLWLQGPDFEKESHTELRALIKRWGLKLNNDLVIDQKSTLENQEATIPIVESYATGHVLTRGWRQRTLFPLSSSITLTLPLYSDVATTGLAQTSIYPSSWAEKDMKAIAQGRAEFNEGKDDKGPLNLVAVAERVTANKAEKDTRIALISTDGFIRNAYQNQTANINFALNLVGWLSHDEGLLSLNRPGLTHEPVVLSAQHMRFVFFITVLTIPILAFVMAMIVYRRRRRL